MPQPSLFVRPYWRYLLALGTVSVSVIARVALTPILADNTPYVFLFPAIVLLSLFAEMGPILMGCIFGVALTEAWIMYAHGHSPLDPASIARTIAALLTAFCVGYIASRVRLSERHAAVEAGAARAAEQLARRSARRFELLSHTAGELLQTSNPQAMVESLCRQVMEHLDCQAFFNFLVDKEADKLHLNACAGIAPEQAKSIEWLEYGAAVCGCVALEARRMVCESIDRSNDPRATLVASYGIRAYACHPLMGPGGQVLGTLSFGTKTRDRFSDDDLSLMRAVTDQVAAAMVRMQDEQAVRAASAAKDRFIAALSHELRTPLTPVLASVSALREDRRLPGDVQRDLEIIHRNIKLEVQLIADLLDVNRIAAGKMHLEKKAVDLCVVLRDAVSVVASDLELKNQRLIIQFPSHPLTVDGDPARLQQVFWNLLRNAVKFTPAEGRICLRAEVLAANGSAPLASISVTDNGIGIDPTLLPRLFQPFEQVHRGHAFGGLGLGLAIARAVVDAHHGQIQVSSDGVDKGTTFIVQLPLATNVTLAPADGGNGVPLLPSGLPPTLSILLVEDHDDTARLMKRLLVADGHTVLVARSVESALQQLRERRVDVLLSDLGLPDQSGHELLRRLNAQGKSVPAIAISGYGTPDDVARSRAAGFAEHLTKPIDFSRLRQALQRTVSPARNS